MESYLETAFLATSYASLGLTLLASVPTALSIARRLTNKVLPWHQDDFRSGARPDDVEESNESTSLLPVKLPEVSLGNWHHFGVTLPTLTGLGASLADIAVTEDKEFLVPLILQTGVWVNIRTSICTFTRCGGTLTPRFRLCCRFKLPLYHWNGRRDMLKP